MDDGDIAFYGTPVSQKKARVARKKCFLSASDDGARGIALEGRRQKKDGLENHLRDGMASIFLKEKRQ